MIGRTIGHYRVVEALGEGGMGVVYRAVDGRLERSVALKFLTRRPEGPGAAAQFLSEARAASSLNHPNIITIYEVGEAGGEPFIAMEYLEGETLKARIRRGPVPLADVLAIASGIAAGLGAAHEKGIVHRDIKSENVMLLAGGRVKIMDFGLALRADADLTVTGVVAGTPEYMSPEQVQGLAVGPPSDLFSFGIVLFEMLARQLPFTGDYELATLYAIVHNEPPRLREIDETVPAPLADIVDRCLRKSPADRYGSCEELLRAIARAGAGLTAGARAGGVFTARPGAEPGSPGGETFVGRSGERATLRAHLDTIAGGSGATLFISGESGVGKSRLAAWAAGEAHARRMNAFWGKAIRQEGGLPYHPFAAALKRGFESFDDRLIERFTLRARELGIDLTPRMPLIRGFLNLGADAGTALHKEQLWDAVRTLLRVIAADRPMLLVIDDLQWADRETLGLFSYLARDLESLPLLLVGIFRPGDVYADRGGGEVTVPEIVRQLTIEHVAGHLELGRFSADEAGEAARGILGGGDLGPGLAAWLFNATLGNPLFLAELVGLMKSRGEILAEEGRWRLAEGAEGRPAVSSRVHDVILERLDRLERTDRELLEFASCEGEYFQSDVLAACLGIQRLDLLKRLQSLERHDRLIRHEKIRYVFEHPLIRTVLYESILDELRQEYHRQIAARLVTIGEGKDELASRIAHHFTAAGAETEALPYVLRAAKRARALCAGDDALRLYRQADGIVRGGEAAGLSTEIAEGLGDVCASLGRMEEARGHFARMLSLAQGSGDGAGRIDALRKSAETMRVTGDMPAAFAAAGDALRLAREAGDGARALACLNTLALIHLARGEYDRVVALSTEALEQAAARADLKSRAQGLCTLGAAYLHSGNFRLSVEQLEEARTIQEQTGDTKGLAATLNFAGLSRHRLGEFERALGYHTESLRIKKSIADRPAIPGSLNNIGEIYRDIGDLDEAIAYHTRGGALAREQGNRGAECDNLRDLAADYLLRGDLADAGRCLDEVLALAKTHGLVWYETRSYITLADLALAKMDGDGALEYSRLALGHAAALNAKELIIEASWVRGKALLFAHRAGEGRDALMRAATLAEETGHGIFLWQIYRDLAAAAPGEKERSAELSRAAGAAGRLAAGFTDEALRARYLAQPGVRELLATAPRR